MADIALRGAELKKMVALAKKRDMNFAYCPGNDPKEDVFVLDRKKKPEVIGRVARAEGTGTKLGMGTASVTGRVMSLTCIKELPQLAKKLKKFLKSENVAMNIIVLDANGNVLEEDVEDLGGADDLEDVIDDEEETSDNTSDTSNDAPAAETAANTGAEDNGARAKELTARAGHLQAAIKDVQPEMQAPLMTGLKGVVGALKAGKLDAAETTLGKLEAAVAKLAGAPATANTAADDPALARLRQVSEALGKRIDGLGNADGVSRLRAVNGLLDTQISDGDAKKATATAKALSEAIARAAEQAAAAAAAPAAETADTTATTATTEANTDDETAADLGDAYRDARTDLEPVILDLLQRNLGDVGKMRAVLNYFTEKGDAQDFAGAMKAVPGLKKLIADAQNAEQTAAEKDIPAGVVPFVRARLDWIKTRAMLHSELTKLQNEIVKICDPEEFPTMADDSKGLFSYLDKLDNRLEDALEALVQEPDGSKRQSLKGSAQKVLVEYQSELNTNPFFQAVDGGNGFKPVNVCSAAMASLGKVNDALSTAA